MNAKMNNNTMGETNDNNNDRGNGCNVRGFMDMGRVDGWFGWGVRRVIIESNQHESKKRGNTMNAMAKFYIATRNAINNERGTTAFETMIITIMLVIVVVVVATMLMGFVDNSDAASNLLGGALGID